MDNQQWIHVHHCRTLCHEGLTLLLLTLACVEVGVTMNSITMINLKCMVTMESLINSNLAQCMFVVTMMEIGVLRAFNYDIHPFEQHYMSPFLLGVPPIQSKLWSSNAPTKWHL
jgi:hypothetical protein